MPDNEFTLAGSHGTFDVDLKVTGSQTILADPEDRRSAIAVTDLRIHWFQHEPGDPWMVSRVDAFGQYVQNPGKTGRRTVSGVAIGGAPAFIGHAITQFTPMSPAFVGGLEAAGYAVVKLPECQMEQRDHGEKRPIFRAPDTDPGYLMVQVQRTDDGYGVGSISGNYTPAEAITRGAVWVAAGVEALRLQGGGDPR